MIAFQSASIQQYNQVFTKKDKSYTSYKNKL